jgi:hypothetical protein
MSEMQELAKRAVACDHWRWMPGMLTLEGYRLDNAGRLKAEQQGDQLPDLNDPATIGCLLALVRQAWDDPMGHAVPNGGWDGGWQVCDEPGGAGYVYGTGETEAEALVVALEMF